MSGIFGIVNYDQLPVNNDILNRMSEALLHRGPDGVTVWTSRNAGLGHCMAHSSPESLHESLPLCDSTLQIVVTAHARIDNREELAGILGNLLPKNRIVTDSDYILAAYEKWGIECPQSLLGDFAVAIWDQRKRKLFCFRDRMGVKPFFYYSGCSFFAFASEIKAILAIPGIIRRPNICRIADFISFGATENSSTFYDSIYQLPPASHLTASSASLKTQRYWHPHKQRIATLTDAQYEEEFRSIFSDAVQCRLRSIQPVGAFLSGGLDSSSIVAATSEILQSSQRTLQTFSGVYDKLADCDERHYFSSLLSRYALRSNYVYGDSISPQYAFDRIADSFDQPFAFPHFFLKWHLLQLARKQHIGVMLDGHDGDTAVSYGHGLLPELALQGRLLRLAQECNQIGQKNICALPRKLFNVYVNTAINLLLAKHLCFPEQKSMVTGVNMLNPHLLQETQILFRLQSLAKSIPHRGQTELQWHTAALLQPSQADILLLLEHLSVSSTVELRFPFFDSRLIEFCVSLPAEQKFRSGLNRNIVRRALCNILPHNIRYRTGKTNLAKSLTHGYINNANSWLKLALDTLSPSVYELVNVGIIKTFHIKLDRKPHDIDNREIRAILRIISLSKWLQKNGF